MKDGDSFQVGIAAPAVREIAIAPAAPPAPTPAPVIAAAGAPPPEANAAVDATPVRSRPCPDPGPGRQPLVVEVLLVLPVGRRALLDLVRERVDRARPELGEHPDRHDRADEGDRGHALLAAERIADPQPVLDARVVRVERREDDVHVQERRRREDQVGDPPAERRGAEDRPERDERKQVALVDAGRQEEEGDREDRQPDEHRRRVRPPGDEDRHQHERRDQQGRPDIDGRDPRDHHRLGAGGISRRGVEDDRVAGPAAVLRHAGATGRREGPRVVGVDAGVRVAAGGLEDLLDQARMQELAVGPRLEDRQPERKHRTTAVSRPAMPVVRIRIGRSVRRSQRRNAPSQPPSSTSSSPRRRR